MSLQFHISDNTWSPTYRHRPDGLAIIDLDSPYNPPRRLRSHGLPWLVVDVQWSPFAARDYWVVSTANHRALVWNLNMREDSNTGAIEHSLQGHSRAITDINFSAHHADQLATCSVDGYVNCWDLRRPRQPALTFCDWFAGATQVKYNRQDPHILASSHDRWLHIWDERRASEPLRSISAHTSKIYGLDWNRIRSTGIVTCSLDKSIKFWDYSVHEDQPEHVIRTDYPVWRARHTPFGSGLLAMPQNEPGDLFLYNTRWPEDSPADAPAQPVTVFPGHGHHKVKEFLWRSRGGISDDYVDNRDFQLVSWGGDNELRLQCADANVLSAVGYVKGSKVERGWKLTRKGATYKTFRTTDDNAARERKTGKMSDQRPSSGNAVTKQSALTLGMRSSMSHGRHHARSAWRGPSMKAKVSGGRDPDPSQSQIGWLKGITMTKRKTSTEAPKRHNSKGSEMYGYPDDTWGEPDTVQEELLRVSTQIPKVKWENINMDELTLNASLNGPWGVHGETIFIKVKIDIPTGYPKTKAPTFVIENTSFMPDETHRKIDRELQELANQFLQRKQNSLEVAFTYLLGEVDLESSTTFFKNVRDLDDDMGGLADDSTSDEDEDIPAGGSASMSQELVPHGDHDSALATPSRTIIPPPPRTCAARFSQDGQLVCFFPSKEEKARVLFTTTAEAYKDRPKGDAFFSGFGKIGHEIYPKQRLTSDDASGTEDESESSELDNSSSSSSSDSESTSIHKLSLWYHPSRQLRKTWSENRSIRSSGGGTGTGVGTGTGTGTSRRRIGRPRNMVSIHDIRPDLPSKKELAQEYAIFGDGEDVCLHNAQVAEKHGYSSLADIWRYLALLLKKGIPLEVLDDNRGRNSILVIAKNAIAKVREGNDECLTGRVKWGEHPLAKEFVADLFEHYERIADIQMLAMLSCIFSESSAEDSVAYAESQLPQPETPLPLKAPSFSLAYYPTDASVWELHSRSYTNSAVTTPRTLHTPVHYGGSQASDDVVWSGEAGSNSYSCGETPPNRSKGYLGEAEALSKSPSSRVISRGLASTFTANLPRSFTGMGSSSPPSHGKKKPSPAETILNSLAPNISAGWASSTAVENPSNGRNSISDDEYRREEQLPSVPVQVSVYVAEQTLFDDDGWLGAALLEPDQQNLHAAYRYAYAEMLQMWDKPLARLEIMKFNVLKEDSGTNTGDRDFHGSFTIGEGSSERTAHPRTGSSSIMMGKKDQLSSLVAAGRGLDVTGVCRVHEIQLDSIRYTTSNSKVGGAVGMCDRCHRVQSQLLCVYCLEPVDALFPPCLSCGCASHETCLAEWHAAGETVCPAGDECNCVEEALNGQIESWAALQGAMLQVSKQTSQLPSPAIEDDDSEEERDRHGWHNVERVVPWRQQGLAPATASSLTGRLKKATEWSRASSLRRNERRM